MKKLIIALLCPFVCTYAFAQAKNFEGFTVGINGSSVGASTAVSSGGDSIDMGQQTFIPSGEIGYTYGVGDATISITGTYDFSDTKGGQVTSGGSAFNLAGKNHYSINLKPGYPVTSTTLLYATIGYNSIDGDVSSGTASGSSSFSGVGYGVGVIQLLDKNVFLKAELQQISYGSKTINGVSFQPSATVGTLGIGYKF